MSDDIGDDVYREQETDILKEQIDKLNSAIMKEEEKAHDLESKARFVDLLCSLFAVFSFKQ